MTPTVEGDETFFVNLTGSSQNAQITDNQGQGTITNDDQVVPNVTINNVSVTEGNPPGTTDATFTVSLDRAGTGAITVNYEPANGTASAPGDYTTTSGTLTFAQGVTSQTITVPVVRDTDVEGDETFFVNLTGSSSNARIMDGQGQGTIVNDDQTPTPATVTLSPLGATNDVGSEHCTTATVRDGAGNLMRDVVVRFSISGPNATNGSDTTGANGEAAFCYTGTSAGEDTIRAFADTNADGTPGTGEPSAQTTKRWIEQPTQPLPCEIEGKGRIDINGKKATFKIDVESGDDPEGRVRFKDHGSSPPLDLRSTPDHASRRHQ